MFRAGTKTNNMQKESTKKKGLRRVLLALGLVCALAAAVILIPNACVVLSTKGKILTLEDAPPEEADCILVLGCGVKPENVRTVDPYDLKATAAVVKEAYEAEDLFVVIVRQPCALLKSVIAHRKGQHCRVNADKCRSCKVCINKTACPALTVGENGVSISTEDCNGCTICQQICPFGAIEKEGE